MESRPSGRDVTEPVFCTERKHRDLGRNRTIFYGQMRELPSLVADIVQKNKSKIMETIKNGSKLEMLIIKKMQTKLVMTARPFYDVYGSVCVYFVAFIRVFFVGLASFFTSPRLIYFN